MSDHGDAAGAELRAVRAHAYENPRPEVQVHVPRNARRILDLGCSSGALGAALKARQPAEVVGVEVDRVYASAARSRVDRVVEADIERLFGPEGDLTSLGTFDCLIAADVLEHLRDPWSVLAGAAQLLSPGGTAVISLPNVRYWHVLYMLGVKGTWPRFDSGICDRTHLRFFSLSDACQLVRGAGLVLEDVDPLYRLRPHLAPIDRPTWVAWPLVQRFFAFQYILVGRRP